MSKGKEMTWMELVDMVMKDVQSTENEFLYPHNRDEADSEIIEGLEIDKAMGIMKDIASGDLVITEWEINPYGRETPMEMTWERYDKWVRQRVQWTENGLLQPYNQDIPDGERVEIIEQINMFGLIRQLVDGRTVIVDL